MAYYAYDTTRALLGVSDNMLPVPENGSVTEIPGITALELRANYTWDPLEAAFIEKDGVNKRLISKLDYMNRFTDAELVAIYTAAKTNINVEIWLEKFKLAAEINLDDARTSAGLQVLETAGLIATGRAAEILT
jgi:hypothetical protein